MPKQIDELIPCNVHNKIETVEGYIGKTKEVPYLQAKNGDIICKDLSISWLVYMREAINEYYKKPRVHDYAALAVFYLPGKPIAKEPTKGIVPHDDGTFTMSYDREFAARFKMLYTERNNIVMYKEALIPFKCPVTVEMVFYIAKDNKRHLCLSELVTSTLEILVRLKILKNTSCEVVARTDGSKIVYTKDKEQTIVTIRRLIERE